jgi:hypothetical protein
MLYQIHICPKLHPETDKRTYRNSVKAAQLAIAAGEETGVTIILK